MSIFRRPHGYLQWMGTRSVFLWGPGFPVLSRRIARRVSSSIWVVLGERLAVVGKNCLQEGGEPVRRKRVLDSLAWFRAGRWAILVATAGEEWRWDSQRLLCRHFCDTLLILFSVYHRRRGTILRRRMKEQVGWMLWTVGRGTLWRNPQCRGYGAIYCTYISPPQRGGAVPAPRISSRKRSHTRSLPNTMKIPCS